MRPRIGIPTPTSRDYEYNERCWAEYALAVRQAGGEAVDLPLADLEELRRRIRLCTGFVLPGSPADVEPELYGHTRESATAAPDPDREACDRLVLESVEGSGAPLLAICFGMQMLNTLRGGTLVQDLMPIPVNHAAGAHVGVAHTVLIANRSLLGGLLTANEAPAQGSYRRLAVNSSHHQAVAIAGEGLMVTGRSLEDGVIEVVEGRMGAAPVIGTQWHPERSVAISAVSGALFLWLVSAAADLADDKGGDASYAGAL